MAARPESLRAEARRLGTTMYQVRVGRARARGITRAQAMGKPRRAFGEIGLRELAAALREIQTIRPVVALDHVVSYLPGIPFTYGPSATSETGWSFADSLGQRWDMEINDIPDLIGELGEQGVEYEYLYEEW